MACTWSLWTCLCLDDLQNKRQLCLNHTTVLPPSLFHPGTLHAGTNRPMQFVMLREVYTVDCVLGHCASSQRQQNNCRDPAQLCLSTRMGFRRHAASVHASSRASQRAHTTCARIAPCRAFLPAHSKFHLKRPDWRIAVPSHLFMATAPPAGPAGYLAAAASDRPDSWARRCSPAISAAPRMLLASRPHAWPLRPPPCTPCRREEAQAAKRTNRRSMPGAGRSDEY